MSCWWGGKDYFYRVGTFGGKDENSGKSLRLNGNWILFGDSSKEEYSRRIYF